MVKILDKTVFGERGLETYIFQNLSLKGGFDDYIDMSIDRKSSVLRVTYLSGQVFCMTASAYVIPEGKTPTEIARKIFEQVEALGGTNAWAERGNQILRKAVED